MQRLDSDLSNKKLEYTDNYSKSHHNCQHENTEVREHHYHAAGLYCSDCGRWIKWISKAEYAAILRVANTRLNGGVA
jgi:hypothetical protein